MARENAPIKRLVQVMAASSGERWALGGAVASIAIAVIHQVFSTTPELFPGGARLGDLLYNLALSYTAGYIFYVLVVAWPRHVERLRVLPVVVRLARSVVGDAWACAATFAHGSGIPYQLGGEVPEEVLRAMCRGTDLNAPDSRTLGNPPLAAELLERLARTRRATQQALAVAAHLDSELTGFLLRMGDSTFLAQVEMLARIRVLPTSGEFLAEPLRRYLRLATDFHDYVTAQLGEYETRRE